MTYTGLRRVISGGQTGADQGGLLAAWRAGLETGGTAPLHWYTERGKQPLLECLGLKAEGDYRHRTTKNVRESDATILLSRTLDSAGSRLTRNQAASQRRPFYEHDISETDRGYVARQLGHITDVGFRDLIIPISSALHRFIVDNHVATLNVAGNRDDGGSTSTTYAVCAILTETFRLLHADDLLIRKSDF